MNKLLTMMAFVRVAESGSFTAAATQLGVSVSAVAKAVSRLEEDIGVQLLVRTTRKLALNDDDAIFFRAASASSTTSRMPNPRSGVRAKHPRAACAS